MIANTTSKPTRAQLVNFDQLSVKARDYFATLKVPDLKKLQLEIRVKDEKNRQDMQQQQMMAGRKRSNPEDNKNAFRGEDDSSIRRRRDLKAMSKSQFGGVLPQQPLLVKNEKSD